MDQRKSRIITEQVFGSSRKIQFIDTSTPMNSLLSAIDHANTTSSSDRNKDSSSTQQTMSIESLLGSNSEYNNQSQSTSINEVSIASLLTSDNTSKRRWDDSTSSSNSNKSSKRSSNNNNNNNPSNSNQKLIVSAAPPNNNQINTDNSSERHKTIITCLHASVAQKSYGSEKRFLCPPPIVQIKSPSNSFITAEQRCEKLQLSMSVICENGTKILEQRSMLDENQSGSFKYLHVTGTAKAKQFNLKVDLLPNLSTTNPPPSPPSVDPLPLATFISKPISIISKPSKKTAKTRNISTCILANSPVSLFNRINSQTVRTKYMTSSNNMLCAKNTTWSPFDIIIVNQPKAPQPHKSHRQQMTTTVSGRFTSRIQLAHPPPPPPPPPSSASSSQQSRTAQTLNNGVKVPVHVTYGTEIILRDSQTGVQSPSLIIRKVDKGRIAQCAYGPVSQMQKIALQLASTIDSQPIYLSAAGSLSDNSVPGTESTSSNNTSINTWLDYSPSRLVQPEQMTLELSYEEVDDYLCWTIVGIAKFEYDYNENDLEEQMTEVAEFKDVTPPPSPTRHTTPFPILSHIEYKSDHTLNVIGQHLIQAAPVPRLLDLWLGTHALVTRISKPPQPHKPHETHWSVQLPPTQDLLVANHDLLVTQSDGTRCLELALLLVRQDGLVYHTGKALSCNLLYDTGRWSVVTASSS
ncbi:hypothetical protein BDF21DRAFT_427521 [Thamnidium elegans]|uniref:Uncharacterized protein n=1 Tax=Thamnidium elegans TaxID=101142 RepID=A0A8H7W1Q2_9FUNG|nr:hypothetical protein INT48_004736 [Thamnidium elegans]KAI8064968.1 hypothetical protein BDF21DRAFT_427521 [Thamnidium elegans]